MTPDVILRLAALGVAVVLAGFATAAVVRGRGDGPGCLAVIFGVVALLLVVTAFSSGPVIAS